jgi:polar amino acid transport system permease protein
VLFSLHTLQELLRGALVTIEVTAAASVLALAVALVAGTARLSRFWLVRTLAGLYIEFFRGTSALVQLFVAFFVLPYAGITLTPFQAGVLAIGLNCGSYTAEIVRAGVQAVPKGQLEAAAALDMPRWARFRRVVAPNAIIIILRPVGNQLIDLLKLTSLVSLVTLNDLTQRGQELRTATGQTAEVYVLLLVFYFLLASLIAAGINVVERRVRRGIDAGSSQVAGATVRRRGGAVERGSQAIGGVAP